MEITREYNVPTFFFINKLDRTGANLENVINEIKANLTKNVCYIESLTDIKEELIEFIAERDEELLEMYLNGEYNNSLWINKLRNLIKQNNIFPCFAGSALQDQGITDFLDYLEELTFTDYKENDEFSGIVYKIRHDNNGTRITFIKALSGILKVRDEVNNKGLKEKISSIEFIMEINFLQLIKLLLRTFLQLQVLQA